MPDFPEYQTDFLEYIVGCMRYDDMADLPPLERVVRVRSGDAFTSMSEPVKTKKKGQKERQRRKKLAAAGGG